MIYIKAHNRIVNGQDFNSNFKGIKLQNLSKKKNPFCLNKESNFLPDLDLDEDDEEDFINIKHDDMDEDEDEDYGKQDHVGLDEQAESQESIMKKDLTGGETPSAQTPIVKVESNVAEESVPATYH